MTSNVRAAVLPMQPRASHTSVSPPGKRASSRTGISGGMYVRRRIGDAEWFSQQWEGRWLRNVSTGRVIRSAAFGKRRRVLVDMTVDVFTFTLNEAIASTISYEPLVSRKQNTRGADAPSPVASASN
jgi:hypothetical protein